MSAANPGTHRRGGKPKGYKHTEAQLVVGDVHTAEAELAFVCELNEALPSAAFEELRHVPDVADWARRWGIHTPRVLASADAWVKNVARWPRADMRFVETFRNPGCPVVWCSEYRRLNELPVDTAFLDDVLESLIEPISRSDVEDPRRRAEVLQKPRVLAPVGADPLRESRDAFLRRARHHFDARKARAARMLREAGIPVRAASRKRSLYEHTQWLVQYRVHGRSIEDIAGVACVSLDTVTDAIRRLTKRLHLTGRRRRPARPLTPRRTQPAPR